MLRRRSGGPHGTLAGAGGTRENDWVRFCGGYAPVQNLLTSCFSRMVSESAKGGFTNVFAILSLEVNLFPP